MNDQQTAFAETSKRIYRTIVRSRRNYIMAAFLFGFAVLNCLVSTHSILEAGRVLLAFLCGAGLLYCFQGVFWACDVAFRELEMMRGYPREGEAP